MKNFDGKEYPYNVTIPFKSSKFIKRKEVNKNGGT